MCSRELLARGCELFKRTRKGDLHWKVVSVYINRINQVMLKIKSRHVAGTITKKKKNVVLEVIKDTLAWSGRHLLEGGENRRYFGLKTVMRSVVEFERRNQKEYDIWTQGILTAKTHWHDYCMMVQDSATFMAVASNTSDATPNDLFEDVAEELLKQYHDDKARVKDAVKLRKISLASIWIVEGLRAAIIEDISSPPISDVDLKLVFKELLERVMPSMIFLVLGSKL
ncbi:hypothetical protein REPUB_Repub12eG0048600 [Reevesia pubescens]